MSQGKRLQEVGKPQLLPHSFIEVEHLEQESGTSLRRMPEGNYKIPL
jgi:hypothetical protein